jgi:acyl carrier protein
MNHADVLNFICQRIQDAALAKGSGRVEVGSDTAILGGSLPLDSLDLAAIVVELETVTGRDPFRDGFVNFTTVGQLASLYSEGN